MRAHQVPGGENRQLERRQLTVVFCDLVGSTALSQRLDPEDLLEVVHGYRKRVGDIIVRYEGFVARYVGDGILAYFGYPQAHEDDASRAILAALEVVEALHPSARRTPRAEGEPLDVRIGIATGLVVVGDVTSEGTSEPSSAWGETPNLAARLQTLAAPNGVVVADTTRELAGAEFEYEDAGARELKGFDEAVRAWRVIRRTRVESRFAARAGPLTSLVGRHAELAVLLERWSRARAGDGQWVLVSGEAGIGKSRIAEALVESIRDEPHLRLRFQCSPHHVHSPMYPFIEEIERVAGLRAWDSLPEKLQKLEGLEGVSRARAPLFAALLSPTTEGQASELTPQQRKDQTLAALLERIEILASKAPVLLLLEDAHWIDPTSIEFLGLLAARAAKLRILALITSRKRAGYPWAAAPNVTELTLERLDRDHSKALVDHLLRGKALSEELREQIIDKTDGVPLFIEEIVKAVEEGSAGAASAGALRSEIPSTLQDSLMARLDQLGTAKKVAQIGAVIGREFSRELLAQVAALDGNQLADALHKLTFSTVVFGRGRPPWTTFSFKHALVQDAAYASLLRSTRQELHGRVATTLEERFPEWARNEPEVVAHHYSHAGQPLAAARHWAAAAHRALDRCANAEALGEAAKGLAQIAEAPDVLERDRTELALEIVRGAAYRAVNGFASSDAERCFARARELAERLGDTERLIEARRGLFSCYYARGSLARAADQGRALTVLGKRAGDPGSRMLGHWMLGCISFWQGKFAQARTELEEAYSLYDPRLQSARTLAQQIDPGTNSLLHLGWVLWILGFPELAVQTSEKAIATARGLSQPFALAMALFWACTTRACCGQHAALRPLLDELLELTAEHRLRYLGTCARVLEGQELLVQGRYAQAVDEIAAALSEFRAQEAGLGLPWALSIAAQAHAGVGNAQEGLATLATALQAASRNGEHHWEAELWRLKGELLLLAPGRDEAQAEICLRKAIEVARRQSAKSLEDRAAASLARMQAHQGETKPMQRT
ncbi:MAG: ATP-binding protein [Usitatibacter sp.]